MHNAPILNIIAHYAPKMKSYWFQIDVKQVIELKKKSKGDIKHLSLRIDEDLLRKFSYIADYQDRSMNWMVINLVSKAVKSFEEKNGEILLDDSNE